MQYIKGRKRPWKVQMNGRDGKQVVAYFVTKEDAQKFEAKLLRERSLSAVDLELPPEPITLIEATDRYLTYLERDSELTGGTIATNNERLSLYWFPKFGLSLLSDITERQIKEHLKWMRSMPVKGVEYGDDNPRPPSVSKATANRAKSALSCVFKWAMQQDPKYVTSNPCRDIPNESEKTKSRKTSFWETMDQVEKYIATAHKEDPVMGLFAEIALFAGPRLGEMLALQVGDIDEAHDLIWIRRVVDKNAPGDPIRERRDGDGKGGIYSPPLFPRVKEAVRKHLSWTEFRRPKDFLIHNPDGTRMTHTQVQTRHYAIIEKAKLPRITIHDLRRTYASLAEEAGFTREDLQLSLGHKDSRTTQNYIRRRRTQLVEKGKRLGFGGVK